MDTSNQETEVNAEIEDEVDDMDSFAALSPELRKKYDALHAEYEKLRIKQSIQDEDLKSAALSTERLCEKKVKHAESMLTIARKELADKVIELKTAHTVIKKLVDHFNVVIGGLENAQKKGAFTLSDSYKYWSAILQVRDMFKE